MSLHGTLETFALSDVLALLAATRKTGQLRVVGGSIDGRVWLDAGKLVASEVGQSAAFVDAVFDLLRLKTGKFSFDADVVAPAPGAPVEVEGLLAEAQARLEEWLGIEAVVPSLRHALTLAATTTDPHVLVSPAQWKALVAVATAGIVDGVIASLGSGEFATCRLLKELADGGLVTVGDAVPERAPAPVATAAPPMPAHALAPEPAPEAEADSVEAPTSAAEDPAPVAPAPEVGAAPVAPAPGTPAAATSATAAELPPVPPTEPDPLPVPDPAQPEQPASLTPPAPTRPIEPLRTAEPVRTKAAPIISAQLGTPAAQAEAVVPPKPRKAKDRPAESAAEVEALANQVASMAAAAEAPPAPPAPAAPPARPEAAPSAAEAVATTDGAPAPAAAAEDEPINRGLLLKFLSSVRT